MMVDRRETSAQRPAKVATQLLGGLWQPAFSVRCGTRARPRLGRAARSRLHVEIRQFRPIVLDRLTIDAEIVRKATGKPRQRYFRIEARWRRLTNAFHDCFPTRYQIDGHRVPWSSANGGCSYDPTFETLSRSTYLIGYWQSYRYFEEAAERIRREIRPAHPPSKLKIGCGCRALKNAIPSACMFVAATICGGKATLCRLGLPTIAMPCNTSVVPHGTQGVRVLGRHPVVSIGIRRSGMSHSWTATGPTMPWTNSVSWRLAGITSSPIRRSVGGARGSHTIRSRS